MRTTCRQGVEAKVGLRGGEKTSYDCIAQPDQLGMPTPCVSSKPGLGWWWGGCLCLT
jgi:hypothetical protein